MPITPINRPDGRHFCRPASADPEESPITCPDCGIEWEFDRDDDGSQVWSMVGEPYPVIVFDESPGD